ncbi:hypothetical protein A3H22_02270 [Candidatus Peribacteria bacterium RIFCSPLOWO2_12_FULL_55_15]|nr:MAG: hypothetical protein A3H90_00050 [Candidatus Peribacteria bacterium RIFCSPLOWO2_02_FULL_55_36]OGJ70491.1 MAG: hypothetical protein A3H22_02270 [Candidatus Peribacteria bacterium RIFCSPLOWO2_12_FULL_55_15]
MHSTEPMRRSYDRLLPYAFRRFSLLSARRTLVPTILYYGLSRLPLTHREREYILPPSYKPALFTMNILPPMATVWYHFVRKNLGDSVDAVIFDCSGRLNPENFPGARVQKFLNFYAATKSDEFLYHIAKNRRIGWLCDDDMFPMSPTMLTILEREFAVPNTASVSFRPRDWWHFVIDGKTHEVSSSYCTAINREIFVEKEHLSLQPADGNTHPSHIGKHLRRYDTFDKANEILLQRGYRCSVVPKEERDASLTGFSGMSGAVILLSYFRTPEETLDYYRSAPLERWSGNVLFGTLSSLLAICTIQELYTRLTGKAYALPSLPKRAELERIRENHRTQLRPDQSVTWFDTVADRLHASL